MKKRTRIVLIILLLSLVPIACSRHPYNENYQVPEGQPQFPLLTEGWVIDNGCNFSDEAVATANNIFERLKEDGIAEVAVVCQIGIKRLGPTNDELIWARNWGRYVRLGNPDNDRAIVWLIRPDVKPEEDRITIERSTGLWWYTSTDYGPTIEEAANYANWNNFDGALISLARNTDDVLRHLYESHK